MNNASITARLSAFFIDAVIFMIIVVGLVYGGISFSSILYDKISWYGLSWQNKVVESPYNVYVGEGNVKVMDQISKWYHFEDASVFDTVMVDPTYGFESDSPRIDEFFRIYFSLEYQTQDRIGKSKSIHDFFMDLIEYDPRYQQLSQVEKSEIFGRFTNKYIINLENDYLNIEPPNDYTPFSSFGRHIFKILEEREKDFIGDINHNSLTASKTQRYLVKGEEYYLLADQEQKFVRYISGIGLTATKTSPDKVWVEVSSIDYDFMLSILVLLVIYCIPCMLVIMISWALLESSKLQGTLGKLLLRLKVVDFYGDKIGYDRAFKRAWFRIVSLLWLGLDHIVFYLEDKRSFADRRSGTYVVEKEL